MLRKPFFLIAVGIVLVSAGGGILPTVAQTAQEPAAKPVVPAFSSLHTAIEPGKAVKVTVVQHDADKDGTLVDEASFDVTLNSTNMVRIERTRLDYSDPKTPPVLENPSLSVFDGKTTVEYDADNHRYLRLPSSTDEAPGSLTIPTRTLWFAVRGISEKPVVSAADEIIDGNKILVENSDVTKDGDTHPTQRQRYLIDPQTHLLRRLEILVWQGDTPHVVTRYDFSAWKRDPVVNATYFDWIPSSEAKEVIPPK